MKVWTGFSWVRKETGVENLCTRVHENCASLGYYAASSGNFYTDVSGLTIGPIFKRFLALEDGTDR
jgi:hypothetical protein